MDAENIGSHAPYTLGASADAPLWKSRYLKVQGNISSQTSRKYSVDDVIPTREDTWPQGGIETAYITTPVIETMGMDPMISSAAVIHELAYGRTSITKSLVRTDTGYMMQGSYLPVQLDLIV